MDKSKTIAWLRTVKEDLLMMESISTNSLVTFYIQSYNRSIQQIIYEILYDDSVHLTVDQKSDLEIILRAFTYTTRNLLEKIDSEINNGECDCEDCQETPNSKDFKDFKNNNDLDNFESSSSIDFGDEEIVNDEDSGSEI